jgi:uncharacterized protein (UPF0335 family)
MSDDFLVLDGDTTADANGVTDTVNTQSKARLKTFIERIQNVEEQEAERRADKKEIYAEAKGEGYDTKALRKLINLMKKDKQKREAEEAMLDLYIASIGGLD